MGACRGALLNVAVALLLGAGLPEPPPPAPPAPPAEHPCLSNPLCSCRRAHLACTAVPLHRFPVFAEEGELQHVSVSAARLEAVDGSALDRLRLHTLVLVADGLARLHPHALLSMSTTLASLDLGYNEFTEVPIAALQKLKVLNWLSLQNNYIKELHPEIDWGFLEDSLSSLSVSNNRLCELRSGALKQLKRLVQLDLEGNRLRHVAADALPPALVQLRLADNLIHQLPCDTLAHLPRLHRLQLRNNVLSSSYNQTCHINHTRKMDSLDLSHNDLDNDIQLEFLRKLQLNQLILDLNDLTTVPSFVYQNGRLEKLSISFNKLQFISDEAFRNLKHDLQQLELDHNSLSTLPSSLGELMRLRYLSLSYNLLEELRLVPPHLHSLSLAGNFLISFPSVLKELAPSSLSFLDLSYNQISQLMPGDFESWSAGLTTLNLKGNRITQLHEGIFPATMPIREMILSFNDLYYVDPNAFANVTSSLQLLEFSSTLFSGEFPVTSELDKLSWISFDNNNIHIVTSTDLMTFPSLEYLNLEYNKIIEFPADFLPSNVTYRLKDLRLSYNFISKISSHFLNEAMDLHSIDLSYNRMQNLSESSFTDLPNLAYLSLAGNVLDIISEKSFYNLPKLELLDLRENSLNEFSTDFFDRVSNEETNFSVNISSNSISHMFGNRMVPINILDCSQNLMSTVPKAFFTLLGPYIRQIILSRNRLTHLENSAFGALPNLEILSLQRNNISVVKRRAFSELSSLQILDLSYNAMAQLSVELFHNMRHLRYLKLNNNHLKSLPRDVFKNTVLEHVDLNNNNIGIFPSSTLSQVGFTLRYLDLSHNNLEYLDSSMFQSFSFLLDLNLSHNLLTVLSDNTFSSLGRLRKLNLSFNSIKTNFKELFHNLPNLRCLDLANVGLKSVPYLPLANLTILNLTSNYISSYRDSDMRMLQNLHILNLSYNRLTAILPSMWTSFKNLITLDISHNPLVRITQGTFKGLENLFNLKMKGLRYVEVIERKSFRPLLSLRTLDIQLFSSFSQTKFSLSDIVANTPNIETLVIHVNEETLADQLHHMDAKKLRYLEIHGNALKYISEDAFKGLERQHQLLLKITDTSLRELPHGFMKHLALIPHLGLDLSNNQLTTLNPAAFYPNITSWSHVATKLLSGGLVLSGNPLRCSCEVAWVGAWLRRWLAESVAAEGGAGARAAARAAVCWPPAAPARRARALPLLQLDADEAECHASALSSRSQRPLRSSSIFLAFSWIVLVFSLS